MSASSPHPVPRSSPFRRLAAAFVPGAIALATGFAPVVAQSQTGPYDCESFEAHRFAAGALPGNDMWSGQDAWMLLDSLTYPANLAAASVQTAVVKSGAQAIRFDAAMLSPGCFGELRRNALFSLTSGVIEIEFDFLLTTGSNPSDAWECYTQPAPHPQSCQLRWWITDTDRIEFLDTPSRVLVQTNHYVTRGVWHHARSVVDVTGNHTEVHIDDVRVISGTPIATFGALPDHGFTQIDCVNAGNDAMYLDNFRVRERVAAHGLRLDPKRLPINQQRAIDLQLAGGSLVGNRQYVVLASVSGTSPGAPLGSVVVPLNVDGFMGLMIEALGSPALAGFLGTFSPDGDASARFDLGIAMPPALLGLAIDFAYVTVAPFDRVSEPARAVVTLN